MSPSILADVQEIDIDGHDSAKREELDEFSGIFTSIVIHL